MLMLASLLGMVVLGSVVLLEATSDPEDEGSDDTDELEGSVGAGVPGAADGGESDGLLATQQPGGSGVAADDMSAGTAPASDENPSPLSLYDWMDRAAAAEPGNAIAGAADDLPPGPEDAGPSAAAAGGAADNLPMPGEASGWDLPAYRGGAAADLLDTGSLAGPGTAAQIAGGDGEDTLLGASGADVLCGDAGSDFLQGGHDDDWLDGGRDDDLIEGGPGDDTLIGGMGDDRLAGGTGADSLTGGQGDDLLKGDQGADALHGGHGADTLVGGAGADSLFGGWGDDLIDGRELPAAALSTGEWLDRLGPDYLNGGAGNDTILAGPGDVVTAGEGADSLILPGAIGEAPVEIMDYDAAEDALFLFYDPAGPAPDIHIAPDPEAGVTRVLVDGTEVAALRDTPDLTPEDIRLVPRPDAA